MTEGIRPDGLVLAAGAAQRMGRPKAFLEVAGETFLDHAVRVLRDGGCRHVYVVTNEDPALQEAVAAAGATVVVNADPRSEQLDSVQLGLRALPEDSVAAAVLPVDCPLVTAPTVQTLTNAALRSTKPVVLPMYNGVGGHPVLLRRPFYDAVLGSRDPEGLSGVIIAHGHQIELLTVTDAGILVDIDTQEEYTRLIGGAGETSTAGGGGGERGGGETAGDEAGGGSDARAAGGQ